LVALETGGSTHIGIVVIIVIVDSRVAMVERKLGVERELAVERELGVEVDVDDKNLAMSMQAVQ
jgi:hypothetical protein